MSLRAIQYHVLVLAPDANGGPGETKLELDPDALNLVWQQGLNRPGQAAFTLHRFNPKESSIEWMVDHLRIVRECARGVRNVFAGKLVKPVRSDGDIFAYAWDYLAFFQRSRTGFETEYATKKIGTELVGVEWAAAKAVANSLFAFVATGTIEDPLGLDGATPITTNAEFGVTDMSRLLVLSALAEMSMANTANNVVFEITREAPHTFNFWKNRQATVTDPVLCWPGNVTSIATDEGYDQYVNDLATSLADLEGGDGEYVVTAPDVATSRYRRLQAAMAIQTLAGTTSGVTEADQGKAAIARMLATLTRIPGQVNVVPRQGEVDPFVGWTLGDKIRLFARKADRSGDALDTYLRAEGITGAWSPSSGEYLSLALRGTP